MSNFVLDLIVEGKRLEGEWVECDDPNLNWYGCRFLIKPATTQLAERVQKIQRLTGDGRNIVKFTQTLLKDILLGAEGIGTGEREATLDEVIAYFSQVPAFVAWVMEQSLSLSARKRERVETELGN